MACERHVLETSTKKYGRADGRRELHQVAEGLNVAAQARGETRGLVPAIKQAVKITESGKPFLLEIIAKEGYDFSRYGARDYKQTAQRAGDDGRKPMGSHDRRSGRVAGRGIGAGAAFL
jgi:hypothetical protein